MPTGSQSFFHKENYFTTSEQAKKLVNKQNVWTMNSQNMDHHTTDKNNS